MAKGINLNGSTVTARDDAFINNALYGTNGVYDTLERLSHNVANVNNFQIRSGMACIQGRQYIVYPNEIVNLSIQNGTQNAYRNDLIVLEFDRSSNVETMSIKVVRGTPSSESATDPSLVQQDTLSTIGKYQLPLYRVRLKGINLDGVDDLRSYVPSMGNDAYIKKNEYPTIYYGTEEPSASLGKKGDIYFKY